MFQRNIGSCTNISSRIYDFVSERKCYVILKQLFIILKQLIRLLYIGLHTTWDLHYFFLLAYFLLCFFIFIKNPSTHLFLFENRAFKIYLKTFVFVATKCVSTQIEIKFKLKLNFQNYLIFPTHPNIDVWTFKQYGCRKTIALIKQT